MTSEEYGQYIDDFELDVDVMPGESLTEYIERRRREFESKADGGSIGIAVLSKPKRQNFFMGGSPLEGQALAIYNSMNATGATDQAIADRLTALGLYDPNASTDTPGTTPGQTLGYQGNNEQDITFVDKQDYSFNKKNYAPGGQLEINPEAFGISFEKASKPQGIINQALKMPGRTLTSFASPTTKGNIIGPAEEGFMSQVVDIDPAGRTREELRQQYDSYNRFFGAPSNYAAARTPGKFGQVLGTVVGAAAGIPFLGQGIDALSKMGGKDKSDTSLFAVDNVGFGQGTQRDEFGVFTGGKTLFGDTTSYGERMAERLGELGDFFGEKFDEKGFGTFDINNLDSATLSKMKGINSFYAKQVQAYQQRLERDRINKAAELEKLKQEYIDSGKQKEVADLQKEIDSGKYSGGSAFAKANQAAVGGGSKAKNKLGQTAAQATKAGTGTKQGYTQHYARGGLATMFTRRRQWPELLLQQEDTLTNLESFL